VAAVVLAFGVAVVGADLLDLVMVQGVVVGPLGVAVLGALGSGRADAGVDGSAS